MESKTVSKETVIKHSKWGYIIYVGEKQMRRNSVSEIKKDMQK